MKPEELSELSDEELLEVARKNKPSPVFDAFFIGFLIGIILFGVLASAWGFLILIPLYMIYRFLKKPQRYAELREELEKRNLS